VKKGCIQDTT
jgi:hypothetical protein